MQAQTLIKLENENRFRWNFKNLRHAFLVTKSSKSTHHASNKAVLGFSVFTQPLPPKVQHRTNAQLVDLKPTIPALPLFKMVNNRANGDRAKRDAATALISFN
jgi:hypothetical protein